MPSDAHQPRPDAGANAFLVLARSATDAQWRVLAEFVSSEDGASTAAIAAFEAAYSSYAEGSGPWEYKLVQSITLGYEVRPA